MDLVDITTEREQVLLDAQIKRRQQINRESLFYCNDCGNEIPAERRNARRGITRCFTCQSIAEQKARHFRK